MCAVNSQCNEKMRNSLVNGRKSRPEECVSRERSYVFWFNGFFYTHVFRWLLSQDIMNIHNIRVFLSLIGEPNFFGS